MSARQKVNFSTGQRSNYYILYIIVPFGTLFGRVAKNNSKYGNAIRLLKLLCPEGRSSLDIPPKITTNKNKRGEIPGGEKRIPSLQIPVMGQYLRHLLRYSNNISTLF
jgi:hypothetical protein